MKHSNPHDETAVKAEFTRLYDGCAQWLQSYLFSLLRHHEDADEVLQETARVMWEKFDQYHPGTEFRAWACRIAYFKAQNHRKKMRRTPSSFSDLLFDVVTEETVVMADRLDARSAALTKCLEKLPLEDRDLLRERYQLNINVAAVARSVGRSAKTVYRSLARIHEALFECVNRTLEEEAAR